MAAFFETKCPHCGAALQAQEEWNGMSMQCPVCGKPFTLTKPGAGAPGMPVLQVVKNNGVMESAVVQKSREIMSTSLQTVKKIKLKRDIQKILSVLSALFFLAACIVFFTAVCTKVEESSSAGHACSPYEISTYGSVSVGESSYGTYKNAQYIGLNTEFLLQAFWSFQKSYSDALKKEDLFHTSYGLFGIAIFLLFVSIYINQIWHLNADQKS